MKEIRFKKPKSLDIDGIARAYVAGDVRDYLPENICASLVACGDAEYVLDVKAEAQEAAARARAEGEETEEAKAEAKEVDIAKQHQPKNKEDKLMRLNKKADK